MNIYKYKARKSISDLREEQLMIESENCVVKVRVKKTHILISNITADLTLIKVEEFEVKDTKLNLLLAMDLFDKEINSYQLSERSNFKQITTSSQNMKL